MQVLQCKSIFLLSFLLCIFWSFYLTFETLYKLCKKEVTAAVELAGVLPVEVLQLIDDSSPTKQAMENFKNRTIINNPLQTSDENLLLLQHHVKNLFRVYKPWQGEKYGWCVSTPRAKKPIIKGLLLAKTYKTGSSTASGVTLQIAHRVALRKGLIPNTTKYAKSGCHAVVDHRWSVDNELSPRRVAPSFLWTIVRQPKSRALSAYFFYKAGLRNQTPTNENIIRFVDSVKNQQIVQLRTNRTIPCTIGGEVVNQELAPKTEQEAFNIIRDEIMPAYDFIAVMERMDTSLAVLKLLLDLEHGDLIVGSSKQSGGWDWNWTDRAGSSSFQIPKPSISDLVKHHTETTFRQGNGDYLLHAVANHSLDLTIEALGRDLVDAQVQKHRKLKAVVQERCKDQITHWCSSDGVFQHDHEKDCYHFDQGCGFRCINKVLDEYESNDILDSL